MKEVGQIVSYYLDGGSTMVTGKIIAIPPSEDKAYIITGEDGWDLSRSEAEYEGYEYDFSLIGTHCWYVNVDHIIED